MGGGGGKEYYNSSVWREHWRPVHVFSISDGGLRLLESISLHLVGFAALLMLQAYRFFIWHNETFLNRKVSSQISNSHTSTFVPYCLLDLKQIFYTGLSCQNNRTNVVVTTYTQKTLRNYQYNSCAIANMHVSSISGSSELVGKQMTA